MKLSDSVNLIELSTKERSALEKLGIFTIGQFLSFNPIVTNTLRGYGSRTYKKLSQRKIQIRKLIDYDQYTDKISSSNSGIESLITSLSIEAKLVIKKLGVTSIAQLAKLTHNQVHSVQKPGQNVWQEISRLKLSLQHLRNASVMVKESAKINKIEDLPFFSGNSSSTMRESDIDEHFQPYRLIDNLRLSIRARNAFRNAGITKLGQVLCKTPAELLKMRNMGVTTLHLVKENICELLNESGSQQAMGLPFNINVLESMPLYSSIPQRSEVEKKIHKTYYSNVHLQQLNLHKQLERRLRDLGIFTIGELLFTLPEKLLQDHAFGSSVMFRS